MLKKILIFRAAYILPDGVVRHSIDPALSAADAAKPYMPVSDNKDSDTDNANEHTADFE